MISLAGILLADVFWAEEFFIEVKEFFCGKATEANRGIRLFQLSDLHIKSLGHTLKTLAQQVNETRPDLILITGDALDKGKNLSLLSEFLDLIHHDIKKVAIPGNWEYWSGVDFTALKNMYADHNCDLLINANKQYTVRDKTISITGVDDLVAGNPDIDVALKGILPSDYHVILNHCPQYSDVIAEKTKENIPVDFMLSGHTHGGQINLFGWVPYKPPGSGRYLKGWYKDDSKNLYVSKGIGISVFPGRFMARAEAAIFNIA